MLSLIEYINYVKRYNKKCRNIIGRFLVSLLIYIIFKYIFLRIFYISMLGDMYKNVDGSIVYNSKIKISEILIKKMDK